MPTLPSRLKIKAIKTIYPPTPKLSALRVLVWFWYRDACTGWPPIPCGAEDDFQLLILLSTSQGLRPEAYTRPVCAVLGTELGASCKLSKCFHGPQLYILVPWSCLLKDITITWHTSGHFLLWNVLGHWYKMVSSLLWGDCSFSVGFGRAV